MADEDGRGDLPGRLERTLKTAWLGGRVGARQAAGRVVDVFRARDARDVARRARHADAAAQLVSTMTELRGPLMKVGQLLSTHREALPPEVARLLEPLQESAPPMPWSTVAEVLARELGAPPAELFATLGEQAVAAASLGQVHRGRARDGREVAVKVQYPGADASVAGDMRNLRLGAALVKRTLADLSGSRKLDFTGVAEEIAEHLAQETDYCREAYNAKVLGRLFDGDPRVLVPRVHDDLSGLRVVTYDWVEGRPLAEALSDGSLARRREVCEVLVHAFWTQLARGGLLHADPHPGNFRVLPDGRLGLLDFGCVKVFDEAFLGGFLDMVAARIAGDEPRLRAAILALELVDDPDDMEELAGIRRIVDYCAIGLDVDEVDFGRLDYVAEARALVGHFVARRALPPPQRQFLFLTRVVVGLYEYFARAGVTLPVRALVAAHVGEGWSGRAFPLPPYEA